jgi:hypothetical protein
MRNLALMWVLAGCLLGCGGRDKDAKDKAAPAVDTAVVAADTVASVSDTAMVVAPDSVNDSVTKTKPDTDTLNISNKLPDDNLLIENLKELFVIERKVNFKPQEMDVLSRLVEDNVLKDLSVIKSITAYPMRDKSEKIGRDNRYVVIIWEFDNRDNAKLCFDGMLKFVYTEYIYYKPPRLFFLVSNKWYEFGSMYDINRKMMLRAAHKLIDCCFSKSEVYFPCHPYHGKDDYCSDK